MTVPALFRGAMRLPAIAAPMFLVSGPALVIETCQAGVAGTFPALNARTSEQLDGWLAEINSGKSFIYTLPILQACLNDPDSRALCLFPLKALAQDQLKTLEQLWRLLPESARGHAGAAAIYDGDTTDYRRRKIRELPPPVLITNPDMLHLGLLPHHAKWGHFFAGLRYVVIDEVHTYRGVFGSHVAWVLRRLKRICALYGADPTFVLASATIGNPGEHARLLIDAPAGEITRSGAGRAARHVLLINPLDSAATTATLMLEAAVSRGLEQPAPWAR